MLEGDGAGEFRMRISAALGSSVMRTVGVTAMIVLTGVVGAYPMAMADVDLGGPRVSPRCVSTTSIFHANAHRTTVA